MDDVQNAPSDFGNAGGMTDAEKVQALRAALNLIISGIETGLTNERPPLEWVVDIARFNLERTK